MRLSNPGREITHCDAQLVASNNPCATGIQGCRTGVEAILIAVGEREKAAAAIMVTAQA
ncbi:MAG TPA: hypothetical protein VIU43_05310 [Nitrosospira sp.]